MVAITSVLFPLYIYPSLTSNGWDQLYTAITANPDLNFDIVINPDSGPGGSAFPNSDYITSIAKLNTYENTNLHGYVHTTYGTELLTKLQANISIYDDWAAYAAADITLAGIFFDEAPSQYSVADYSYMSTAATYARNSGFDSIIFNPGAVPDASYYAIADKILAFENTAGAYSDVILGWIPSQFWNQTAFMMYGYSGTAADQKTLVDTLADKGLGGLFITTASVYDEYSSLWAEFCAALSAA